MSQALLHYNVVLDLQFAFCNCVHFYLRILRDLINLSNAFESSHLKLAPSPIKTFPMFRAVFKENISHNINFWVVRMFNASKSIFEYYLLSELTSGIIAGYSESWIGLFSCCLLYLLHCRRQVVFPNIFASFADTQFCKFFIAT